MKKILLAASLFIAATSFASTYSMPAKAIIGSETSKGGGVHIPASQVPKAVKATFKSMFPTATNVRWELETEHGQSVYQADFLLDGVRWRATFQADGTLISAGPR